MRRLAALILISAGLVFAQEAASVPEKNAAEHSSEEHKGGVAEVSVVWKWANFAILFGILAYLAAKNAGPLLAQRSAEITEGLAAGERAKAEAEEKAKAVDARLANLEGAIEAMRAQSRQDRERETARLEAETVAEIDRIARQANMEIESAGKQATIEVRRFGARLALELAETKVRARMTPETQIALLNNFEKTVADSKPQDVRA